MSENSNQPVRKITDIDLAGTKYALAKNGEFILVDESGVDIYGKNIGRRVLWAEFEKEDICKALLEALGKSLERIQALEMARERQINRGAEGSV